MWSSFPGPVFPPNVPKTELGAARLEHTHTHWHTHTDTKLKKKKKGRKDGKRNIL